MTVGVSQELSFLHYATCQHNALQASNIHFSSNIPLSINKKLLLTIGVSWLESGCRHLVDNSDILLY